MNLSCNIYRPVPCPSSQMGCSIQTFDDVTTLWSTAIGQDSTAFDEDSRPTTHDFSVFSRKEGDVFGPISLDVRRTRQEQAALDSMVKESISFLFGESEAEEPAMVSSGDVPSLSSRSDDDTNKKRKRLDSPSIESLGSSKRSKNLNSEQWDTRYDELVEYKNVNHHCCVPYACPPNPSLARWVKRQRYQYKLLAEGKSSTMTIARIEALENIGFVWDAHLAVWERRLVELKAYLLENGECNVPSTYQANKKLASWVRCQRTQYKSYRTGSTSTLTKYRVQALNELGFAWEVRT